ncbi:MAG: rRNA pseudouridine synthase [Ruminococcus sp.]|nr:rRNA pseudouridine synthase [Ruminococcus sp.]
MRYNYVRLQKFMADCGVASRRKSEEMIENGAVKVNGKVARLGDKINPDVDKVYVYNKRVVMKRKGGKRYIMLNKPRGYVTTMSDEMGRKCVADLVKDIPERIYPVGRLDRDSEGLLLMTNDGDFANTVTHPKKQINKVYHVTVRPDMTDEQVKKLCGGIVIDGRKTAPCEIRVMSRMEDRTNLEMVLHEGRNREIRKMCEFFGLDVLRLRRISIGSVKMGKLKKGMWRDLTFDEVRKLSQNPNPPGHSR